MSASASIRSTTSSFSSRKRFSSTSTTGTEANENKELDQLNFDRLEDLAIKYCNQNDPFGAQQVFEKMIDTTKDKKESVSDDMKSSIMDVWMKYQISEIQKVKMTTTKSSKSSSSPQQLKDIYYAAICINSIVEHLVDNPSLQQYILAIKAWANTCEASYLINSQTSNKRSQSKNKELIRGIPQRAQYLLNSIPSSESSSSALLLDAQNQLIRTWAYSSEYLHGTMVDEITEHIDKPNIETMKLAMIAWCTSQERRSAFKATGYFMRMMTMLEYNAATSSPFSLLGRKKQDNDSSTTEAMKPSINDYHMILAKWTMDRADKNAPYKVKTLLDMIEDKYQKGISDYRADLACYRYALMTIALPHHRGRRRSKTDPEIGELANDVLMEMKKRMIIPDSTCYGSAIMAWKNVAMMSNNGDDDSNNGSGKEAAIKRALDLLREMIRAYHQTTTTVIKPTIENYNHVLQCLSVSSNPTKAIEDAMTLLDELEQQQQKEESSTSTTDNSDVIGPNAKSYTSMLRILRNQQEHQPSGAAANNNDIVQQAVDLLKRMRSRFHYIRSHSSDMDIVKTYSEFIRVCGNSSSNNNDKNSKVMTNCLKVLEEMKSLNLHPDSNAYGALLETCEKLFSVSNKKGSSSTKEREQILTTIFHKICDDGCVNSEILERFQNASSSYLYSKVVVSHSIDVDGISCVPSSWTRNNTKRISIQGVPQGVLPLTIDGRQLITKDDAESRMRKLRLRSNQKMLQGGRI